MKRTFSRLFAVLLLLLLLPGCAGAGAPASSSSSSAAASRMEVPLRVRTEVPEGWEHGSTESQGMLLSYQNGLAGFHVLYKQWEGVLEEEVEAYQETREIGAFLVAFDTPSQVTVDGREGLQMRYVYKATENTYEEIHTEIFLPVEGGLLMIECYTIDGSEYPQYEDDFAQMVDNLQIREK